MRTLLLTALLAVAVVSVARSQTAQPFPPVQFDEISRAVMPGSTPAPPAGAFSTDAAQVKDGKIYSNMAPQMPAMPQMNPMSLGSSLFGAIFNPMGALMNLGMQMVMGSMMNSMMAGAMHGGNVESGRETHVAYYGSMARFENAADQTVTIVDTKTNKRTQIDLAKRQYKVTAADADMPAMPQTGNAGGGTANVSLTTTHTQGGDASIAGIDATEYDTTATVAITNATGSCHDMTMQFQTVEYVAKSMPGPGEGPTSLANMLTQHPELAAGAGCSAKAQVSASGPTPPANRFLLYSRTLLTSPEMEQMAAKSGQKPPQVWMVMERGNIRPVTAADAAGLFAVPAGFAEQQ